MMKNMKHPITCSAALGLLAAFSLSSPEADAAPLIRQPGHHRLYDLELEPHAVLGMGGRRWYGNDVGSGMGLGARFSIPIVDNGFVQTINNSVAISFGADWLHYSEHSSGFDYFVVPVAMQWNFWVTESWSFFGEPGLAFEVFEDRRGWKMYPTGFGGARWSMADGVNMVFRVGYPMSSVGVSFNM